MKTMGGERIGLSESEMADIVNHWRKANPAIVSLWSDVERAAAAAIETGGPSETHGLYFFKRMGLLMIKLPSGRVCVILSRHRRKRFGGKSITYEGLNQTTKQWGNTGDIRGQAGGEHRAGYCP